MSDEREMLLAWIASAENLMVTARRDRWRFLLLEVVLGLFVAVMAVACVFWAIEGTGTWKWWFFGAASMWNAWGLASVLVKMRESWCMFRQMELGTLYRLRMARERLDELGNS